MRHALALSLLLPALCAAEGAAPLSAWRAGVDGIGPIHVGMNLDEARRATGLEFTEEPRHGQADWLACHLAWPSENGKLRLDLSLMLENGVVTRLDVATPDVATRSGTRVGDAESNVLESYKGRLEQGGAADGRHYLMIYPQQSRQVVFVSEDGRITSYRVGLAAAVQYAEGCA